MTPIPKGDRTERERLEDRTPAPVEPPPTREDIRRELGFPMLPNNDDADPE